MAISAPELRPEAVVWLFRLDRLVAVEEAVDDVVGGACQACRGGDLRGTRRRSRKGSRRGSRRSGRRGSEGKYVGGIGASYVRSYKIVGVRKGRHGGNSHGRETGVKYVGDRDANHIRGYSIIRLGKDAIGGTSYDRGRRGNRFGQGGLDPTAVMIAVAEVSGFPVVVEVMSGTGLVTECRYSSVDILILNHATPGLTACGHRKNLYCATRRQCETRDHKRNVGPGPEPPDDSFT